MTEEGERVHRVLCLHEFEIIEEKEGYTKGFFGLMKRYVKIFYLKCKKCGCLDSEVHPSVPNTQLNKMEVQNG